MNQYSFAVDITIIENLSSKTLQIDQLLGRSGGGNQLRKISNSPALIGGSSLQAEAIMLAPSERLIVPLALAFLAQPAENDNKERQISQDRFRTITVTKPGTVFQTELFSALRGIPAKRDTYSIRKVRESFKPPAYPTNSAYTFGPEWALTGLTISGEKVSFGALVPNLVDITRRNETGSCPILYAWSGPEAIWFRHGKILHQADSPTNEQTESVAFDGFVHRFRIAEEELERATISGVRLTIELTNGNILTLPPESVSPTAGKTIALYANDEIDINFVLPENVKDSDVVLSRLTVSGYYDRYPTLILGRR